MGYTMAKSRIVVAEIIVSLIFATALTAAETEENIESERSEIFVGVGTVVRSKQTIVPARYHGWVSAPSDQGLLDRTNGASAFRRL